MTKQLKSFLTPVKKLYKGWGLESVINDLMNLKIQSMNSDKYPDWFKNQFKKL